MSSSYTMETKALLDDTKQGSAPCTTPPFAMTLPAAPPPPSPAIGVKTPPLLPTHASSAGSTDSTGSTESFSKFASLLTRIQPETIVSMALRTHQEWSVSPSTENVTCTLISPPLCGSFNLVHVLVFSDGVKWVLRLPSENQDGSSARRLKSEVMTMNFIRKNTTIPIPEIISFDPTSENELSSPYTIMGFDEGTPVCKIWFDETGPTPLEDRRHRILDTVAAAMSQLTQFSFEKIGMLEFEEDTGSDLFVSPTIGPLNILDQQAEMAQHAAEEDTGAVFKNVGPFDSSRDYLNSLLDDQQPPDDADWYDIGIHKLVGIMVKNLPLSCLDGKESFELAHPDFGGQNFLVSEDGTLTAIIDWDNVQTAPQWIGCRLYPGWLTRDWDPVMYGYPEQAFENSPEELEGYRNYYAKKMASLGSARFTTKSHIHEAVYKAAFSPICLDSVVSKIFHHILPEGGVGDNYNPDNLELGGVIKALAEEGLGEKMRQNLLPKIQNLLSLPEESPADVTPPRFSWGVKLWKFIRKWAGASPIIFPTFARHRDIPREPIIERFLRVPRARNNVSPA